MSELYLPDINDEIPAFVQGLAGNFGTISDELGVFADSRIVEHGSNENGEYWRWANGLQIASVRRTTASNPSGWLSAILPTAFVGNFNFAHSLISYFGTNHKSLNLYRSGSAFEGHLFNLADGSMAGSVSCTFTVIVIGWWK